ncbi:hypothetical protein KGM_215578 [Danaus plexippus plexippus]|uniref:Uncharacterized protein n=1 Tax=Danaus plexippus plexippus TaxID=278856 RepID=A0A212EXG2_DANPL|nr:hypothetical protein KGM_215578 [Danaus plexippus plexippus]
MYLYDPLACGYNLRASKYVNLSAVIHVVWLLVAIALRIIRFSKESQPLKYMLATVLYTTVFVTAFDLSMAIVYIAHIQQSLTYGMILRYSGWSVEMKVQNYDDFGGWFPMVASICWMRGVIILALNVYSCRVLQLLRRRVRKGEEKRRLVLEEHGPIPEAEFKKPDEDKVLYYRTGEHEPSRTILSVIFGWWTLDCRFTPDSSELHEITLIKLLYLYDPEACGRIYFYNVTIKVDNESDSSVMWPIKNIIAKEFRTKVKVWLALHIIWFGSCLATVTRGPRACGFYAITLPFTLTGITMLLTDLIYAGLFVKNIQVTGTEVSILRHLSSYPGGVHWISESLPSSTTDDDTCWISLLFAYCSCRGLVQWIINFWLIKDMYFESLDTHNRLEKEKSRLRSKV